MPSRLLGSLTGALLVLVLVASVAGAAGPAQVTVRVEGDASALVPKTTLTTTTKPVVKDGNSQHSCTGTSAAGALEQGTAGQWSGPYFNGLGYSVDVIKGERHTFSDPEYWTLWVNDKSSQTGLCDTELQRGDDVLFYPCRPIDPANNNFDCAETPVELRAPAAVQEGQSFEVSVTQYDPNGVARPASGATVAGSGLSATTGADGKAIFTAPGPGTVALRATKTGAVRSATVDVTVTATPTGGGSPPPPPAADRTPPSLQLGSIRDNAVFTTGHGPRTLRGTAGQDPSGLQDVRIRLVRRTKTRCYVYDNRVERFRLRTCHLNGRGYFSVGDRADFSYLLPERLGRGRYIFDAHALDKAGNLSPLERGTSRIAFSVR